MAYPIMPTERPLTIISLFFSAPAIIGTKGGEHIRAVDVIIRVSASTLKILHSKVCNNKVPKMTMDIALNNKNEISSSRLTSAIDATTTLNTRIKYMPNSNVFSMRFILGIKDASILSVVIESITNSICNSLLNRRENRPEIAKITIATSSAVNNRYIILETKMPLYEFSSY